MTSINRGVEPIRGASTRRSRTYAGRPLLDLGALQATALGHLLTSPTMRMPTAAAPVGPGVYALHYCGDNPLLQPFARSQCVVYVGRGMLRDRWSAHLASFREAEGLDPADFLIRVIPYGSHAEADLSERLLIDALRPVFNEDTFGGLGSRPQGRRRQGQKASPFDVLFPGRTGRAQPTNRDAQRRDELSRGFVAHPAIPTPSIQF